MASSLEDEASKPDPSGRAEMAREVTVRLGEIRSRKQPQAPWWSLPCRFPATENLSPAKLILDVPGSLDLTRT